MTIKPGTVVAHTDGSIGIVDDNFEEGSTEGYVPVSWIADGKFMKYGPIPHSVEKEGTLEVLGHIHVEAHES